MITVEEIRRKAVRIYPEVLRSHLNNEEAFPKIIRSDKSLSKDFSKMSQEIAEIIADSKDRKGFGYSVKSEPIKTKLHGTQNIPNTIVFETLMDFLKFLGKKNEYDKFVEQTHYILTSYPQLKECLIKKPELTIDNFGIWADLLKVCDWFVTSFEADRYYIRELPVSVHSKFIEENKATLRILLDKLIPEKINTKETDFEKRYRLKYAEPTIRFRLLDSIPQKSVCYSDISVPLAQFTNEPLSCARVIIIENLMNFLTFPQVKNGIAVWGKGFAIDCLKQVKWLENKEIFYWSDLDVQGFQMLSQLRSYFSQTQSFLMDIITLNSYKEFWVKGTPTNINDLNFLNEDECQTFLFLKENNIRLEQERILHSKVLENPFGDNPHPLTKRL